MTARRAFLQWLGAAPLATQIPSARAAEGKGQVRVQDAAVSLQFDEQMRCRIVSLAGRQPVALTGYDTSEHLVVGGKPLGRFTMQKAEPARVATPFGAGQALRLAGRSLEGIEKRVTVTLLDEHPGVALLDVSYVNTGGKPLAIDAWVNAAHRLAATPRHAGGYWTYSGASHADRRDWVQPVKRGFEQRNFLGMNASDYGGGTPVVDVWRRDVGLAVGHLALQPLLVALPVKAAGDRVDISLRGDVPQTLAPGATFATPPTFLAVHRGDFYVPLDRYRRLMAAQGLAAPEPPQSAYEAQWCAWGYERDFSLDYVRATLPKVQELGFKWAVLDDGWQVKTGDWTPDLAKFPRGAADMKALVADIHARGMKARLWIAPLAVAPGSDELHDHTDLLLLDKDGAAQDVTWWNCFYICPAYGKTQERLAETIRMIIGDWGFDGLKVDGQHLNGVAPCFNPKHQHKRPEESVEAVSAFYKVMHDVAHAANPEAVVEVCPCGTSYAFHNMPFMDQAPASDPLSSWQVRHKGKTLKALMGPWSAYAGDHVELSTGGQDFASSVGIGAVVATKFTWPVDPKPKDSFLLTPEREAHWRQWVDLYNRQRLAEGRYRGDLYDLGFDKPETHVVEQDGALHYAFYADRWDGVVALRGLGAGTWTLRDALAGTVLGKVTADKPTLPVRFTHSLLIEARPDAPDALPVAFAGTIADVGTDGFPRASQWADAPATFFRHDWQGKPLAGPQSTRVLLLRGANHLYLRFICKFEALNTFDSARSATDIWPLWERDVVEVFLQAPERAGLKSYREVQVSPNGLLQEIAVEVSGKRRIAAESRARAHIDAQHKVWTADLAVPMRSAGGAGDGWRLNLFRVEGQGGAGKQQVLSAWSPTGKGSGSGTPDFHVPAAFGRLLTAA
ncbi:alpha-galactosidase [Pseudoduganella umbonata]|uniref:Alpha-galactosidase n=1 Tax=Pseudoduganella umbonata TaxID=864828 RepID=A0A4P8HMC1_9BURK|nr:alpha-galactosidase [Pseudoduganella umbonata]MBB3222626.1 alpha-galactosidase [Pseudoduganella umbonata]QCP10863.1 alpha-galactosidase [Pseudoduganella umbonata]